MQNFDQLTPEELGKLFPIIMAEADAAWPAVFEAEKNKLLQHLPPELVLNIEHIGSTAVPGLAAKPTIDILLQINQTPQHREQVIAALAAAGYQCLDRPTLPPPHLVAMKGYGANGFEGQAVHVHVRYAGEQSEIVFRDYLRTHPEAVAAYEKLKKELAVKFRNHRENYTDSKTAFIQEVVALAISSKQKTAPGL